MNAYFHVLLATDFAEHHQQIATQAALIAKQNHACFSLIHVLDTPKEDQATTEQAETQAIALLTSLGFPRSCCWIRHGDSSQQICNMAIEREVDLIIAGNSQGLKQPSTVIQLLHQSPCDVLLVKS